MAPPPPGPTLRTLLDLLDRTKGPMSIALGAYSMSASLDRDGDRFQLFPLYGGIAGVSPLDDRPSKRGEMLFEAHGVDDLIGKLAGVWNSDYGTFLGDDERLYAHVTGDRTRLLIELRQRWPGGLSLADAPAVLDGQHALDAARARCVGEAAAAAGATIAWRCERVVVVYSVHVTSCGKTGASSALVNSIASQLRISGAVAADLLRRPLPITIGAKTRQLAEQICAAIVRHGGKAEVRTDVTS